MKERTKKKRKKILWNLTIPVKTKTTKRKIYEKFYTSEGSIREQNSIDTMTLHVPMKYQRDSRRIFFFPFPMASFSFVSVTTFQSVMLDPVPF